MKKETETETEEGTDTKTKTDALKQKFPVIMLSPGISTQDRKFPPSTP
jgi:hypothetical protein